MHRELTCSGFPHGFHHLASVPTITATRLDLARSLITLGPSQPAHQLSGPFWWSLRGIATIFSLLTSNLFPTIGFMRQTSSQRKTDAFLLGEALTHWFAQTHLGATVVVPLEQHGGTLVPAAASAPYPKTMPKYFRHAVKAGTKSEPDFIAFSTASQVHVLESKGRAGFNSHGVTSKEVNAARNKALRQVCKIATVNGVPPATRTACVFSFDQSGLAGQITDPPEAQASDYIATWPQLIRQAYAMVLEPLFETAARGIGGNYIGIEFMPGWLFGIDRNIYKLVRGVEDEESAWRLFSFLSDFTPDVGDADFARRSSAGRDGHILIGGSEFSEAIWRRGIA